MKSWRGSKTPVLAVAAAAAMSVGLVASGPDGRAAADPDQVRAAGTSAYDGDVDARGADSPSRSSSGQPREARPNVLLITVDDMNSEDLDHMPRTERLLAAQGTVAEDGLAPTPICAPARASLLTGEYSHNHGVLGVEEDAGFEALEDGDTLPVWLREAGYHTSFAGKYLNGYGDTDSRYIPPGWDDWRAASSRTYSFFQTRFNVNGQIVEPRGYSTDILADYSIDMITGQSRDTAPWFTWVNYIAPHHGGPMAADDPDARWPSRSSASAIVTTTPAKRHENTFEGVPLPDDPSMWEEDVTGNRFAAPPRPAADKAAIQEAYEQRLEALQAVDEAVARTVEALERTGELEDTLIILSSDNGFLSGHHNRQGKLVPYDASLRIPILLRGPGVPRGRHLGTPVTNPDIAVTIAAAAGALPGRSLDGIDVLPLLSEPDRARVVPIEAYRLDGAKELYSGIRYGDLTYVAAPGAEELYDRSTDPGEVENVAGRPEYQPVLEQLRAWDTAYRDCSGDTCPKQLYPAGRLPGA